MPELNRDPVSSVWRAGPQPRSCEFSVACRTSTAKCVRKKNVRKTVRRCVRKNVKRYVRRNVRKNAKRYVRKNVRRYVRKNVKRYARKNLRLMSIRCQKECQNIRKYEDHSKKVKVTGSSAGNKMYVSQPSPSQLMCASVAASLSLRMCHFRFRTLNERYRYFKDKVH